MTEIIVSTIITSAILCGLGWWLGKHFEQGKQADLRLQWANSVEYKSLNQDEQRGSLQMWRWIQEHS